MFMTPDDPAAQASSFRHSLREATAPAHAALDRLMSGLDLATPQGRAAFSRIQLAGFRRLGRACGWQAAEATPLLCATVSALDGLPPTHAPAETDAPLHADAVAYVTLGSQLGLTVLRQRLRPEERTGAFAPEPDLAAWKSFATRLTRCPPGPAQAEAIRADALRAFDIFRQEAQRDIARTAPATFA